MCAKRGMYLLHNVLNGPYVLVSADDKNGESGRHVILPSGYALVKCSIKIPCVYLTQEITPKMLFKFKDNGKILKPLEIIFTLKRIFIYSYLRISMQIFFPPNDLPMYLSFY